MDEKIAIGKFLYAILWPKRSFKAKTEQWGIYSTRSDDLLGSVAWFGRWRQYTFNPSGNTTFNLGCLYDLYVFLKEANENHRKNKKRLDK